MLRFALFHPQGVTVIQELLSRYGQGGNCGFAELFYYQNSFLIADSREVCTTHSLSLCG